MNANKLADTPFEGRLAMALMLRTVFDELGYRCYEWKWRLPERRPPALGMLADRHFGSGSRLKVYVPWILDFTDVSPIGLRRSPVAEALAGLRANVGRCQAALCGRGYQIYM